MSATFGRRQVVPQPGGDADVPSLIKQLNELSAGDLSVLREGAARLGRAPITELLSRMSGLGKA
jgi:hypothetical protein